MLWNPSPPKSCANRIIHVICEIPTLPSNCSQNLAASPCWLRRLFLACVAVCSPNPKEARRCLAYHAHPASAEMEYLLEEAFPTTLANSVGFLMSAHSQGNDSFVHKDERLWIFSSLFNLLHGSLFHQCAISKASKGDLVLFVNQYASHTGRKHENEVFTKNSSGIDTCQYATVNMWQSSRWDL